MKSIAGSAESQRVRRILRVLRQAHPDARCALLHDNPFQLLIATILSAQCTDERVNRVTRGLFARYPGPQELAQADSAAMENEVRSTGFFRAKTRSVMGAAAKIHAEHNDLVPQSMESLLELPGVARKTANVVLGTGFGIPSGVVVDTHVKRVAGRLGLTVHEDPVKIEQDLMRAIPQSSWISFSHQLIFHGRRICRARTPRCGDCPLLEDCRYPARRGSTTPALRKGGAKT